MTPPDPDRSRPGRPALVATDLDGTLLRSDGSISERSAAALRLVDDAGSTVVVVTGRPVRWITDLLPYLGAEGVAVVSNGAGVFDLAARELVRVDAIDPGAALEMAGVIRSAVPDAAFAGERVAGFVRESGYRTLFGDAPGVEVGTIETVCGQPLLKLLVRSSRFDADALLAAATEVVTEGLGTLTHSAREGLIEISAAGVTKATAVERLAGQLGLTAADVVAFGDMPNDVPMLAWAGRSWAVRDAHPAARAAARHLTASNDDDGVAVVLEELFATGS